MTVTIARASLVLALLLGIALGVQSCRLRRADRAAVDARAKAQAIALEAAGWQRAAVASQDELARVVPALEAQVAALRKADATLAGSSRWTGRGAAVSVPCTPDNMAPPADVADVAPPVRPPDGSPGEPLTVTTDALWRGPPGPSAEFIDVTPHVLIEDAVAIDDAGGIYVARDVKARLSVGKSWINEWSTVTPDPETKTATVHSDIAEAWAAWKSPPYRIDASFGASIGINGLGIVGQVSGGRGRLGWFAQADYVLSDPSASRIATGGRFTIKK